MTPEDSGGKGTALTPRAALGEGLWHEPEAAPHNPKLTGLIILPMQ